VWDKGGLNLLAEKDASGNVTAEYIHGYSPVNGIGTLVAAKKTVGETTYYQYPQYDHRGTVVGLTDKTGAVIASYEYNAFGEVISADESTEVQAVGNRFRYQSNWMVLKDSGDRFYISAARVYDAKLGRFLQRDPLFSGQFLAHRFAFSNKAYDAVADSIWNGGSVLKKKQVSYSYVADIPNFGVDPFGLNIHLPKSEPNFTQQSLAKDLYDWLSGLFAGDDKKKGQSGSGATLFPPFDWDPQNYTQDDYHNYDNDQSFACFIGETCGTTIEKTHMWQMEVAIRIKTLTKSVAGYDGHLTRLGRATSRLKDCYYLLPVNCECKDFPDLDIPRIPAITECDDYYSYAANAFAAMLIYSFIPPVSITPGGDIDVNQQQTENATTALTVGGAAALLLRMAPLLTF